MEVVIARRCVQSTRLRTSFLRSSIFNAPSPQSSRAMISGAHTTGRRKGCRDFSLSSIRSFKTTKSRSQEGDSPPTEPSKPATATTSSASPPSSTQSSTPPSSPSPFSSSLLYGQGGILAGGLRQPNTGTSEDTSSSKQTVPTPPGSFLGFKDVLDFMGERPSSNRTTQRMLSEMVSESFERDLGPRQTEAIHLRLKPTLGRTTAIDMTRSIDVGAAFRILERKCSQNNVKKDERTQRIYVRRGQRRKDLRRSRWRVLFKAGFLNELSRIKRMKAQGW